MGSKLYRRVFRDDVDRQVGLDIIFKSECRKSEYLQKLALSMKRF